MSSPFHIVALNPPAKRVGKSKGSAMAKRRRRFRAKGRIVARRAGRTARRGGKKFMGLSMGIVETGVGAAAGILGTNYVTGLALEKLGSNKPAGHWTTKPWTKVAIKAAIAVGIAMVPKVPPRFKTPAISGALASAALSAAKILQPAKYDTRWGLAGTEDFDTLGTSNISAELGALAGSVDSQEIYSGQDFEFNAGGGVNGLDDSAGMYALLTRNN